VILGISSGNRLKSHTITCQISVLCSDYIKFGFISFLLRAMPRQSDPRKLRSWPVLFWAVLRASSTVPQRGFEDRDSARLQSSRYREGISSTEMPLGQRARSREMPSGDRPRVRPASIALIVQRRAAIQNCCRCPVQQNLRADPPVVRGVNLPLHQRQRSARAHFQIGSSAAVADLLTPFAALATFER
jgi:hypothetical protein